MRQRDELELLRRRISFVGYVMFAALLVLATGFWNFQLVESAHYTELADKNRIRQIPMLAQRGRILDREGRILVDSRPSYNIVLLRDDTPTRPVEEALAILAPGIRISEQELKETIDRKKREAGFRPIVLKEDVGVEDIAFVKSHKMDMPEIEIEYQPRRRYLEGTLAAHAIGYLGQVTDSDLRNEEFQKYRAGDEVGKTGIERTYDAVLRGVDGYRRVVVDKLQREVEQLGEELAVPGNDLRVTIDLDLQRAAEDAIGDRAGAAVAIDPRTGEILVLASKPAFDPNLFATRLSQKDLAGLNKDPRRPFRNRVVQDAYSPGSVFKIFMAAAGIEAGILNPLAHVDCNGAASFYGNTHRCWKSGGHGRVSLYQAIVDSCNVFFYNVGKDLGIQNIKTYMDTMGLGRKTGIDIPNETAGLIPSVEWKRQVRKADWYPGETISVAIGQGAVSVTPLQATVSMGALASGGRIMQPHFVRPVTLAGMGFRPPTIKKEEYPIHQSTVDLITRAMWGVVNEGGTGTRAAVEGFDVAGKTGTAQVVGNQYYGRSEDFEDNAWFVGFAPYRVPEIAVGVFIEHGGHGGSAAAPVAHAVFDTYYKKKTGKFTPTPATPVATLR
jgi:penicillin-binding protein 2